MANPFSIAAGTVTGAGSSRSYTVTAATSSGDTLCVLVGTNNTTGTVSACTDSKGNVYTLDKSFTTATPMMYMFRSPGATGGSGGGATAALTTSDTITLTTAAVSCNTELAAASVPGVGAVDQIATITSGTSTSPSVSATPGFNNETLIGALVNSNGGGAPTLGAGFTQAAQQQSGTNQYVTLAYDILTGGSGVSQTFSATITSANWRAGLWTFQAGAGGQSAALTVAQETVAAPAPTLGVSGDLAVAQETISAPAPTTALSDALPVAQETVSARAPTTQVGAVSLALTLAQVNINAPAPTATVAAIAALPTAQVNVNAPAPAAPVPTLIVALTTANVSAKALQIFPYAGPPVMGGMGGTIHTP